MRPPALGNGTLVRTLAMDVTETIPSFGIGVVADGMPLPITNTRW